MSSSDPPTTPPPSPPLSQHFQNATGRDIDVEEGCGTGDANAHREGRSGPDANNIDGVSKDTSAGSQWKGGGGEGNTRDFSGEHGSGPKRASQVSFNFDNNRSAEPECGVSGAAKDVEGACDSASAKRSTKSSDCATTGLASSLRKSSSLELRKVPTHILLGSLGESAWTTGTDEDSSTFREENDNQEKKGGSGSWWDLRRLLLTRTCLRPTFTLRTQMILSFGLVSAITILFVIIISIIMAVSAGNEVKATSSANLQVWAKEKTSSSAGYVADAFMPMLPTGAADILCEAIRDRFVGYPDLPGYEDDLHVPFPDIESGTNKYPLDAPPLKLDWQIVPNVNSSNHEEHVQHRYLWYKNNRRLSTAGAFYSMQGACDPLATNPTDINYYINCTDANNDVQTGGVVRPTNTNKNIYLKAKDLQAVLKPLYEYAEMAKSVGVYFANAGAGASVVFPHYEVDYAESYTSIGCDWMNLRNPLDPSKPIGTPEMIEMCHPEGEEVPNSEYNPMETAWCRDQALNPHRTDFTGPYLDTRAGRTWQLLLGKAAYDRLTNEFIACTLIDINLDVIRNSSVLNGQHIIESGQITVIKWDEEGTVIASPNWDPTAASESTTIGDTTLGLGINSDAFQSMRHLVNFDDVWDPKEARNKYKNTTFSVDKRLVSFQPIPPVPEEYDPDYKPYLMIILSMEEDKVFASFYDLGGDVDEAVNSMIIFTVVMGFAGVAIIFAFIFATSLSLTRPLEWMNSVSRLILTRCGDESVKEIDTTQQQYSTFRFSPKTELNALVSEFQKMVSQFSGDGTAAKAVKFGSQLKEAKNRFTLLDEFHDLYLSRKESNFEYGYGVASKLPAPEEAQSAGDGFRDSKMTWDGDETLASTLDIPGRIHFGPNRLASDCNSRSTISKMTVKDRSVLRSPLFWWIIGLVVVPLLLTTIAISSVVMWNVSTEMTTIDTRVKEEYLQLEQSIMGMTSRLRAMQASAKMEFAARNLHVYVRNAEWLMFGGLNRSEAFTEMTTGAEQCKTSEPGKCDYYNSDAASCDCEWNHPFTEETCQNYSESLDTRYLQRLYWVGLSQDAHSNGDRNFTSYPELATTPNTTAFWYDVTMVPGSEKGASSSGHGTTYDRLRTIAALSAISFPLYNYEVNEDKSPDSYIGFEADGMLAGYGGCNGAGYTAGAAFFQSSESNGAERINGRLCPLNKFGYDSRCRGWHASGKNVWLEDGSPVYVTPPYLFASSQVNFVGQSCTGPLIDPITGDYVGQAGVDFIASTYHTPLSKNTPLSPGGFPILITMEKDVLGVDTAIGPNFTIGDEKAIEDLVIPYDPECNSDDCPGFHKVAKEMRAGKTATTSFLRTTAEGSIETVHISYAPVSVKSFRPVNSSEFSSGVKQYSSMIYSLGIAQPEEGLLEPFQATERDIQRQVNISIAVLATLVTLATVFLVYVSYRVTVSITVPILHLLELIKNINRMKNKKDIIPLDMSLGSRELFVVYETFSSLCLVLQSANSAFFSGYIDTTYQVLADTLRLFRRLGNKKAIGVACNNLGNCMLTMYRTMDVTKEQEICGLSKAEIISKGSAYFRNAIQLGEEAYDKFYEEEGWSGNCLAFMQHLSNRYFNYAMFLLTVKKDHEKADEAERLGLRNLEISGDMDVEIADQCLEVGFSVDEVELFDMKMSRIRGLISVLEMSYPDAWDTKELMEETFKTLRAAVQNPSSDLFTDVSAAGRMQQLDVELIRYARIRHETEDAARICIRMLIEDEYIFKNAELVAVTALIDYVNDLGGPEGITQQTIYELHQYEEKVKTELEALSDQSEMKESGRGSLQSWPSATSTSSSMRRSSSIVSSMLEANRFDATMEVL